MSCSKSQPSWWKKLRSALKNNKVIIIHHPSPMIFPLTSYLPYKKEKKEKMNVKRKIICLNFGDSEFFYNFVSE